MKTSLIWTHFSIQRWWKTKRQKWCKNYVLLPGSIVKLSFKNLTRIYFHSSSTSQMHEKDQTLNFSHHLCVENSYYLLLLPSYCKNLNSYLSNLSWQAKWPKVLYEATCELLSCPFNLVVHTQGTSKSVCFSICNFKMPVR